MSIYQIIFLILLFGALASAFRNWPAHTHIRERRASAGILAAYLIHTGVLINSPLELWGDALIATILAFMFQEESRTIYGMIISGLFLILAVAGITTAAWGLLPVDHGQGAFAWNYFNIRGWVYDLACICIIGYSYGIPRRFVDRIFGELGDDDTGYRVARHRTDYPHPHDL